MRMKNTFEAKYKIADNEATKMLHKSRRMFAILEDRVLIADEGVPYSHAKWFQSLGLITPTDDKLMTLTVRGASYDDVLDFYVGYDFSVNEEAEKTFFSHLKEITEKLQLASSTQVCGGKLKGAPGEKWPARKKYGTIEQVLGLSKSNH